MGLPLEIFLLDFSDTNYSSARASINQARINFQAWQKMIIRQFHQKVYRWQVARWMSQKIIPADPAFFKHEWIAPAFPWVDPEKDAKGWAIRIDRGLVTYDDAVMAQNKDPEEENNRREKTIRRAIERAQAIKKDTGVDPGWERFAGYDIKKSKNGNNKGVPNAKPE